MSPHQNAKVTQASPIESTIKVDPVVGNNHFTSLVLIKEKQINFAPHKADLSDNEKQNLKEITALIVKNQRLFNHVEIVGHADHEGSDDNSLDISRQRALNVSDILKSSGLSNAQILTSWRGNTEPLNRALASEGTHNSRVELKFYGVQKGPDFNNFIEELNKHD